MGFPEKSATLITGGTWKGGEDGLELLVPGSPGLSCCSVIQYRCRQFVYKYSPLSRGQGGKVPYTDPIN